ncbi:MAG: efflux RND transporter periplasmic adaptor subunit [Bacteriovoracales bacterium]
MEIFAPKNFLFTILILIMATGCKEKETTAKVKKKEIIEVAYAVGTLESKDIYQFRPGTSLNLQELYVDEGDFVKKGQPLLKLDSVITAPFDGTVINVPVHPGENVSPAEAVIVIENLKKLQIKAILEQKSIFRVKTGQKVKISFEELPGKVFDGKVSKLYSLDPQFIIYVEPQNLPESALPGMTVDLVIEVSEKRKSLVVPIGAFKNGKVLLIKGLGKMEVNVEPGIVGPDFLEIKSDKISENDELKFWN